MFQRYATGCISEMVHMYTPVHDLFGCCLELLMHNWSEVDANKKEGVSQLGKFREVGSVWFEKKREERETISDRLWFGIGSKSYYIVSEILQIFPKSFTEWLEVEDGVTRSSWVVARGSRWGFCMFSVLWSISVETGKWV